MSGTRALLSPLRLASVAATALLAGALLVAVNDASGSVPPAAAAPAAPAPSGSGTPNTSPFPPTAPANLRVTAVTSTSVTLSWTASTPGCCQVTGYDVTYMQAFYDVGRVANLGNVTTATITADIRPGTQYSFLVTAHDDLGHRSVGSNVVVVVTPVVDTGPDTVPPGAPGNLRADPTNGPTTTLTWSPGTDNVAVTGYDVYRFDGVFISTLLATVTGTSYTATVATPRDQFYVRARDAAGNVSIASNTVTVTGGTSGPSSPAASPSSSAPPVLSCRARFTYTSVWATGFVADVTITNTGTTPITDWVITFSFGGDQRVSQAWNATFSQSGAAVTLTRADWNRIIPPGGSVTVGLYGSRTSPPTPPPTVYVNGVPCTA
ncbi:cellulose binding domain-containing protein [Dactylosporangium aurantiacum]|uniref:Cellulose binding domain-containing protein n=1 Tax=Dactylosporangium aurantiacum TaxID=35754 RepID=A0A9Q9ICF7_9ACTN|nr:cellulose binding domain-containing protein [Dactylosporangium aurantiacum]MDG6106987.1 cellulose binding domain-containing protein [Dactylosporangium aurantiacum]UWZ50653.1 cellulose binding domain-containing protein [Dactylosporangium aurantiacum]